MTNASEILLSHRNRRSIVLPAGYELLVRFAIAHAIRIDSRKNMAILVYGRALYLMSPILAP